MGVRHALSFPLPLPASKSENQLYSHFQAHNNKCPCLWLVRRRTLTKTKAMNRIKNRTTTTVNPVNGFLLQTFRKRVFGMSRCLFVFRRYVFWFPNAELPLVFRLSSFLCSFASFLRWRDVELLPVSQFSHLIVLRITLCISFLCQACQIKLHPLHLEKN